jgi:hypothetical protein
MDYESRETLATAYEILRKANERIVVLTNCVEALVNTLVTVDRQTHEKYAAAVEDSEKSARAEQDEIALGVIDSVIATLRSCQMGNA